jgi:hypothetical protein
MFLSNRVPRLGWEIEWVAAHTPGRDDALALLEVVGHVGCVALVAGMNMIGKPEGKIINSKFSDKNL